MRRQEKKNKALMMLGPKSEAKSEYVEHLAEIPKDHRCPQEPTAKHSIHSTLDPGKWVLL